MAFPASGDGRRSDRKGPRQRAPAPKSGGPVAPARWGGAGPQGTGGAGTAGLRAAAAGLAGRAGQTRSTGRPPAAPPRETRGVHPPEPEAPAKRQAIVTRRAGTQTRPGARQRVERGRARASAMRKPTHSGRSRLKRRRARGPRGPAAAAPSGPSPVCSEARTDARTLAVPQGAASVRTADPRAFRHRAGARRNTAPAPAGDRQPLTGSSARLSNRISQLTAELDDLPDSGIVGAEAGLELRHARAVPARRGRCRLVSLAALRPGALALRDMILRERAGELPHVERAVLRERNRRGGNQQSGCQKRKRPQWIISVHGTRRGQFSQRIVRDDPPPLKPRRAQITRRNGGVWCSPLALRS